ncbi:MAG: haloacid dehalogenase-like hydrolase [Anaerolineaceae bacterium]|nr:haloacid dehalogenase-like hydrolase [Anaerolineaceae bacterium]
MRNFDALFFDMDGTLVENSSLMPAAFQAGFANQGLQISISPWKGSGCTDWEVMDRFLADFPELSGPEKEALKEKMAPDIKRIVIETVRTKGLKALPGAPELIKKLVSLEIYPGLLTGNMEEIVTPKLTAAGMDRKDFYYGGFGDHCPKRVDAANKALASASELFKRPIDPARALIIGDTPNDIACARAVNAAVLAVPTGKFTADQLNEHRPDFLIRDLTDIQGFLEIIGQA